MIIFLLLQSLLASPQVLRFDARGKIINEYQSFVKGKPYRVSVQFSSPFESEDALYVFRYDCIDKKGTVFRSEENIFTGLEERGFRSNITQNIHPDCVRSSNRIAWNLFHTRAHLWPAQNALHTFIQSTQQIESISTRILSDDREEKLSPLRKQLKDAVVVQQRARTSLLNEPQEYIHHVKNVIGIDISTPLTFEKLKKKQDFTMVQIRNRSYFSTYWQAQASQSPPVDEQHVQSLLESQAELQSQVHALDEASAQIIEQQLSEIEQELAMLEAQQKMYTQQLKQLQAPPAIEAWPLTWLSKGILYKKTVNQPIPLNVESPGLGEVQIPEKKSTLLVLYNTQKTWRVMSVRQTKVETQSNLPSIPSNLLTLLPGSATLNLALKTLEMVTKRGLVQKYPPPPNIVLQTQEPIYRTQILSLGAFPSSTRVNAVFSNGAQTFEKKLNVNKMRRVGLRVGLTYTAHTPEITSIRMDNTGGVLLSQGVPIVDQSPSSSSLGLLYGLAVYAKPT